MNTPRTFVLSQLKRKPVTDKQARDNYITAITDYLLNLESLEPIVVEKDSPLYEQKQFLLKLLTLSDRYTKIDDEVIPDNKLDTLLVKVQDMCREYLYQNLEAEIYQLNRIYYTQLAFNTDTSIAPKSRLASMKEQVAQILKK